MKVNYEGGQVLTDVVPGLKKLDSLLARCCSLFSVQSAEELLGSSPSFRLQDRG